MFIGGILYRPEETYYVPLMWTLQVTAFFALTLRMSVELLYRRIYVVIAYMASCMAIVLWIVVLMFFWGVLEINANVLFLLSSLLFIVVQFLLGLNLREQILKKGMSRRGFQLVMYAPLSAMLSPESVTAKQKDKPHTWKSLISTLAGYYFVGILAVVIIGLVLISIVMRGIGG